MAAMIFTAVPYLSLCQETLSLPVCSKKALSAKYINNYDSALFYYAMIDSIYYKDLGMDDKLLNDINICEALIQLRRYGQAKERLMLLEKRIGSITGLNQLTRADYLQVKGALLLGEGQDSSKIYLENAIEIREGQTGSSDTLLHYAWNKLGNYYYWKGDYNKAIECHQNALIISQKKINKINYLSASSYQNLGMSVHRKGDYKRAELDFLKSLELHKLLFSKSNPNLAINYINVGKFYSDISNYKLAIEYYGKAELILNEINDKNYLNVLAALYWNKGNIFTHLGDYEKAINYLNKALLLYNDASTNQYINIAATLMDLGFVYEKKGDTIQALYYYSESVKNSELPSVVKSYRNMGNLYKIKNTDTARYYYRKAIMYTDIYYGQESYDMALCLQYYGEALSKTDPDSSLYYCKKALSIFESLFEENNRDIAQVRILIGDIYIKINKYDEAIAVIQDAINGLLVGTSEKMLLTPSMTPIPRDLYIPDALFLKAKALYLNYLKKKEISLLDSAYVTVKFAWSVIEMIRSTYYDEESQMILNSNARLTIDLGMLISNKLYEETGNRAYLAEAFTYSEKGKAIILLSALRGLGAKSDANLPKSLIEKEDLLNQEIATYNSFVYNEKQKKTPDQSKLALWNDRLFMLSQSYDSLLKQFERDYPGYYELKYNYSIVNADTIQHQLDQDQVLIEYHLNLTDTTAYGFLISPDNFYLKKLGLASDLKGSLDSLRQFFSGNMYLNSSLEQYQAFISISTGLYRFLIAPFQKDIEGKRVLIIPDGELGFLAFDVLLSAPPVTDAMNYKDLAWFIRRNAINYSTSATVYFEQAGTRLKNKASPSLLAFAPTYDYISSRRDVNASDRTVFNLPPITGTKEEVNAISLNYHTRKLFDQKASESNFKKLAPDYGILHLAMHTLINNQKPLYSQLVFSMPDKGSQEDGLLNTYELFNLRLRGELAVLSACNTGTGKLERGEGIISLARGFFYAGIPSVVMTLWEIEDHSSADLMAFFYKNLKDGMPKDVALQQAKLSYLSKSDKLHSHPYFWAGFVNIGLPDPISASPPRHSVKWILFTLPTLLLIICGFLFLRRRVYFRKKGH
jgi:CHAT domain-containing protein/tetratricopeptide (TPR) repeat protein